jgi:selenium metabolism protein YedF
MHHVDVRTWACPGPVIELRRLLGAGEMVVSLHVGDDLARSNVSRFAASRGAAVAVAPAEGGSFVVTVTAGAAQPATDPAHEAAVLACRPGGGPLVVQIGAAVMGTGDDELGALLLRSFVKTLAQLASPPHAVLLYNGGVRLACEGSAVLGDLAALETAGVEVLTCGTCLNYYQLADRLAVGRVTDMLEIATRLATAESVLRP